jgi:hypothetical protein
MSTIKELRATLQDAGVTSPASATKTELEAIVALIEEPEVVVDVEVEHPVISTEVDLTKPDEINLDKPAEALPSADRWAQMERISERIASSALIIPALRNKPDDILLVLLAAHDLGIPATQALSKLHIVDGKLSMAAEMMVALVLRDGHELWGDTENSTEFAVCYGRRKGSPEITRVVFTMDDAKLAGLDQRTTWKKYPKSMLWARAVSMLCRQVFPDSVAGVSYTPDELEISVPTETAQGTHEQLEAGTQPMISRAGEPMEEKFMYEGRRELTSQIERLKQSAPEEYLKLKDDWVKSGLAPLKKIKTEKELEAGFDLLDAVLAEQTL